MKNSFCILCYSPLNDNPILSLTSTPPANEFVSKEQLSFIQEAHPLNLYNCSECHHVQLSENVDDHKLFSNYVYVSGTSKVFQQHFETYANQMVTKFNLKKKDFVIDVGSNDGTLLKYFKKLGVKVLGIDPAKEIAKVANENGIKTICDFFSGKSSEDIKKKYGKASLIVANNVFAHTQYMEDFALSVKKVLKDDGVFVFEVSYFKDVCQNLLFDTIYHEHVSYHNVKPLNDFFTNLGMTLFDVEHIDTHGGSLRGYVCKDNRQISDNVAQFIEEETKLGFYEEPFKPILELNNKIEKLKINLTNKLKELKAKNKTIAGYGAPAKATTLMYHFDLGADILDFIVDDSPLKQNLYTPGKKIPVLPSQAIYDKKPDYILILAWNFADSIAKQHQKFIDDGGHFIIPIPELKEI